MRGPEIDDQYQPQQQQRRTGMTARQYRKSGDYSPHGKREGDELVHKEMQRRLTMNSYTEDEKDEAKVMVIESKARQGSEDGRSETLGRHSAEDPDMRSRKNRKVVE